MKWWVNGQFLPQEQVQCSVNTYSLHYGSTIFEGIRAYDVRGCASVFKLAEHLDRFFDSALTLGFRIQACRRDELEEAVVQTVAMAGQNNLYIRPLLYLGNGIMGIRTPNPEQNIIVMVWPFEVDRSASKYRDGLSVTVSRHHRSSAYASAKAAGNYLSSVAAANELAGTGFDEAILLDEDGFICEATAQNIFIVKNGSLHTPRLKACLAGITRQTVMDLARQGGWPVVERDITPAELMSADEAFLTSTASEVLPIGRVHGISLASTKPTSLTHQIAQRYIDLVSTPQ
jgi:branched-chain amino acid aminotransferase